MRARRTSAGWTPTDTATPSTTIPSSAPCRSSPIKSRARNSCSVSVAAPRRAASSRRRAFWLPAPVAVRIRSKAASTPTNSIDASSAGLGRSRSEAHPTPIVPCGSPPERKATAIGTSSGPRRRRHSAISSIFVLRELVSPIDADVVTISSSLTRVLPRPRSRARRPCSGRACQRSGSKNDRMSPTRRSGALCAVKCPPWSKVDQRTMFE